MRFADANGTDQQHSLFFQRILLHKAQRVTMSVPYRERNLMHLKVEIGQGAVLVTGRDASFFQQLLVARGDAAITARHAAGFAGDLNLLPASAVANGASFCGLRLMLRCHDQGISLLRKYHHSWTDAQVRSRANPTSTQDLHRRCTVCGLTSAAP